MMPKYEGLKNAHFMPIHETTRIPRVQTYFGKIISFLGWIFLHTYKNNKIHLNPSNPRYMDEIFTKYKKFGEIPGRLNLADVIYGLETYYVMNRGNMLK